jgi:hypothetical protein
MTMQMLLPFEVEEAEEPPYQMQLSQGQRVDLRL